MNQIAGPSAAMDFSAPTADLNMVLDFYLKGLIPSFILKKSSNGLNRKVWPKALL